MQFKKNPAMEFIETDETGLVIFNPENADTCIVDEIGVSFFKALGDGATLEMIVDTLLKEYAAPKEEIEQDITDFLNQLLEQGIVITCD